MSIRRRLRGLESMVRDQFMIKGKDEKVYWFQEQLWWQHHLVFGFWDLKMKMLYGLFSKENTYAIMGVPGIEEQLGTLRFRWRVFTITSIVFSLCPSSEWERYADEGITFVGFCGWMMSCHIHSQPVDYVRENQERYDPLRCLFFNCEVLQVKRSLV